MVTFTDLLALMLAFFVLIFSMTTVKYDAWDALIAAITDQLSSKDRWRNPNLAQSRSVPRTLTGRAVDLGYLANVLREKFEEHENLDGNWLRLMDDRIVLSLPGRLAFQSGSAELNDSGRTMAASLAASLNLVANRIDVFGHTDPTPVSALSQYDSNWELSLARAVSFANAMADAGYPYLIGAYGLAESRYYELPRELSDSARANLARRVDLVVREERANEAMRAQ
jgi:chemotaxis protein MotB